MNIFVKAMVPLIMVSLANRVFVFEMINLTMNKVAAVCSSGFLLLLFKLLRSFCVRALPLD